MSAQQSLGLEDATRVYLAVDNEDPKPFVWVKSADDILASIAPLLPQNFGGKTLEVL